MKKAYSDRRRMRKNRATEEPLTYTTQDLSDNEFLESPENLNSFALSTPSKDGESSGGQASTSGIELVQAACASSITNLASKSRVRWWKFPLDTTPSALFRCSSGH